MASIKKTVYDIIFRPRITEKSALSSSMQNSFVFTVHPKANKAEIKKAVEKIFDVKVKEVRTLNFKGKTKRVGQKAGQRANWKKAYISLEEGSSLDLIEGL